jgi:hypothetical protein
VRAVTDPEHERLLAAVEAARERLQRVNEHERPPGVYHCDEWCWFCAENDVRHAESELAWFLHRRDGADG